MKRKIIGIAAFTAAIMTTGISASAAETLRGDADNSGTVDLTDAVTVMKYNDEKTIFTNLSYCDVNNDGAVDSTDAACILKAVSGTYTIPDAAEHDIVLSDNGILADGSSKSNVYAEIDDSSNTVTIISPGIYNISGELTNGQIIINIPDTYTNNNVELNLNGVTIANASGPAIYGLSGDLEISAKKGTTNTLSDGTPSVFETETAEDGTVTTTDEPDGCIFSHDGLSLKGKGTLIINGKYANGISGKDEVEIKNLSLTVNALSNAIKAKDYITVTSGTLDLTGSEGDGIRCTNGNVTIDGGSITINAQDNGIFAKAADIIINGGEMNVTVEPSKTADTDTYNYDGIHSKVGAVTITGGTVSTQTYCDGIQSAAGLTINGEAVINITTTGEITSSSSSQGGFAPGQQQTTTTDDGISAKGIKTDSDMNIDGGANITVISTDDSIHANGSISLNNAVIEVSAGDDGVHADDTLTINNGCDITVLTSYEGLEAETININGGTMAVYSTDDMINAAGGSDNSTSFGPGGDFGGSSGSGNINISGGYVYCVNISTDGEGGDGIDSNGSITMTGGTVIVNSVSGSTSNSSIDYDGTFTYKDGYLFAVGAGSMASEITSGLTASNPVLTYGLSSSGGSGRGRSGSSSASSISKGTRLTLTDSSGNVIMTLVPVNDVQNIIMAAGENIKTGNKYTLYTGGSYSDDLPFATGGTLSGGTSKASAAVSSNITSLS